MVQAFISYSHADERLLERLHKHLAMLKREGALTTWHDEAIPPGGKIDQSISAALGKSKIFVALLSPDYLASRYCYEEEFQHALEMEAAEDLVILPVIVEPCDWLSSPFAKFKAVPKDGNPISEWTNENTAFLDIVSGIRQLLEQLPKGNKTIRGNIAPQSVDLNPAALRQLRIKRDFDAIDKAKFADIAFEKIRSYFEKASLEISSITPDIKTNFETISQNGFTCTIVNRAKRSGGEASITVHNTKGRGHMGDINVTWERHAETSRSNGSFKVEADEYNLYLAAYMFTQIGGNSRFSPEQVAEYLWNEFVRRAGIEYV